MPLSVKLLSVIWIFFGFAVFLFRIRTVQAKKSTGLYIIGAAVFFGLSIIAILLLGLNIQLPLSFWNVSKQPENSDVIFSVIIKQRRFVLGLSIVLILSLVSLLMGFFGITAKLKECFPYYIIGILGTLFFTLLLLHNYSLRIQANNDQLYVDSIFGWAQISWNDVEAVDLLTTVNRPDRTYSNTYKTDSNIYSSFKTLVFIDKQGLERIRLSPENISAEDLSKILELCKTMTGIIPSSQKEEKNLNFF